MMLEPKHKRFILALVILAIVAGTATFVYKQKYANQQDTTHEEVDLSRIPDFAMGKVTKVEGNNVYIKGAFQNDVEKELVGTVTDKTEIIRQEQIRGLNSTAKAVLADVKVGQTIVVYYSNKTENSFDLDKIQIVN